MTENAEKRAAQALVRRAIRLGLLKRGPCEKCGKPNAAAHHEDYSRPLDVRFLCTRHHAFRHNEIKQAALLLLRIKKLSKGDVDLASMARAA